MKKRIISLILVVVMSVLTLASCAFNYHKEDLSKYATFDYEAFVKEVAKVTIEDGDFTDTDLTKREKMVADAIYSALAAKADTTVKYVGKVDNPETDEDESEPVIGAHDLAYYCYYTTVEIEGKTYQFMTTYMKSASAAKVQLGQEVVVDDELTEALLEGFKNFTFSEDSVYEQLSSGTIEKDMWVYISYTKEHDEKGADNVEKTITETASNHRVQVTEDDPFTSQLIGKSISSSEINVNKVTVDGVEYTYDNVKVTYAEKGTEAFTFTHTPYPTEDNKDGKKVATTLYVGADNKEIDLAGKELTYHVYPVNYVTVPEFTAENIINEVYGSSISISTIAKLIFGEEYTKAHDAEDSAEAVKAVLSVYDEKFTKDGVKLGLEEFIKAVATAQSALKTAKTALEKAEEEYEKALTALETAKKEYDKAVEDSVKANADKKAAEDAYTEANKAYEAAKAVAGAMDAYNAAKTAYEAAKADKTNSDAYEAAKKNVADKSDAVTKAQKEYDAEKDETKKAELKIKLDEAKAALDAANTALKATVVATKLAEYEATAVRAAEIVYEKALEDKNKKTETAATKAAAIADDATLVKTLNSKKTEFIVKRGLLYGTPDYILTPGDENYETLKAAYDTALEALLKAEGDAVAAAKEAFINARVAFSTPVEEGKDNPAKTDLTPVDADYKDDGAEFDHNKALTERDTLVTEFITVVTAEKLIYGYEYNITYKSLEDEYNLEVKQAIAKIVYNDMLKKYVKFVGELPKNAVNEVYEELIDNYQFCFYQNYDVETHSDRSSSSSSSSSTDKETYYDMYDGSFERFMIELAVPKTLGVQAPASYDEAKALVRARAGEIVKDRISVYVMAAALDAKLTNDEFAEYEEENGLSYADDKTIASHRLARQLVKVLDKILESEEKKAEESGNRFAPTLVTYNKNFIKELVKE